MVGVILGPGLLQRHRRLHITASASPVFNLRHPVFLEWFHLTLPLMVGVSLTYADKWILGYYASAVPGGISRLNVAKNLFNQPMTILGSAAGAASLPFFSSLFSQGRMAAFAGAVNRSVSRVLATALLAGAWMVALSFPIVDLFRGGSFNMNDAVETSQYFTIFAVSIAAWAAQAIYSRSFYAAGNTMTPAIAGWIVTNEFSILIYAAAVPSHRCRRSGDCIRRRDGSEHRHSGCTAPPLRAGEAAGAWSTTARARALLAAVVAFAGTTWCVRLLHLPRGHRDDFISLAVGNRRLRSILSRDILLGTGFDASGAAIAA